ncbi:YkvA family protein [Metabacillus fastidiosus]|uniref:YkvA family protein n=1 Tax=Metabacillus fastidiosus TaxID=1458 RepID=UPI002E1D7549|nr:YkvA family protein [Metabacillus fastidiosus]
MLHHLLKRYKNQANPYLNDKKETEQLLTRATKKAVKNKSSLLQVWSNLQLIFEALRSWKSGAYPHFPKTSLIMIVAAIIYFVSPVDLIPDFLLGLGILDDAAIIAFVAKQLTKDLAKFEKWKDKYEGKEVS